MNISHKIKGEREDKEESNYRRREEDKSIFTEKK